MSHQQQQQQSTGQSAAPVSQAPSTREKQLLTLIIGLQQQVATLLQQNGGARVEMAKPPLFNGKIKEVSMFINMAHLYLSMRMTGEPKTTRMTWMLSYIQEEVAEA